MLLFLKGCRKGILKFSRIGKLNKVESVSQKRKHKDENLKKSLSLAEGDRFIVSSVNVTLGFKALPSSSPVMMM